VLEKNLNTSDTYKNVKILLHGNKFLWIFVHHHQEMYSLRDSIIFRYLQKVAIRDWNKNRELEQFEAMGRAGRSGAELTLLLLKMLKIPTRFLRFFAPIVPFIVA
jgi:hypothetical protein